MKFKTKHVDQLRKIFDNNLQEILLIDAESGLELTYKEFLEDSLCLASYLKSNGVKKNDHVAFSAENSIDLAILYFAVWHCEALVIPVNPQLHPDDIVFILEDCQPSFCFFDPFVYESVKHEKYIESIGECVYCFSPESGELPNSKAKNINFSVSEVIEKNDNNLSVNMLGNSEDESVFLRIYTSGTTSRPKGIDITYKGLIGNELAFGKKLEIGSENRFYNILPMCYLGGIHNLLLLPIVNGSSIVMGKPLAGAALYGFWDTVRELKINTLWFTSAMLNMLMSLRDDDDMSYLKDQIILGLVGMAPLLPEVKVNFEERFGFKLYENYALSETAFLTTNYPSLEYRKGSCGDVLPGVNVEIVDENGTSLPDGDVGQIKVKSEYFMKGYVNVSEEDSSSITSDGFLTGDLGYLDAGELFPTGRAKDLIIRGGLNISPASVEKAIYNHPAVELAAVVGIPHDIYGEEVAGVVTLKSSVEGKISSADIMSICNEHLAQFQRPKLIQIIDVMPLGATGKIDKKQVKQLLIEN